MVERSLAGGETHRYRVTLRAGEAAGITVEQRGIDVVVQVLDPGGTTIAEFDLESRKQGAEPVALVAVDASEFELKIRPRYVRSPAGRYAIRIDDVRPATEQDRALFESFRLAFNAVQLADQGKLDDAIRTGESALALREKASLRSDPYRGILFAQIAQIKRTKGDFAGAEQLFQKAIAGDEEVLGRDNPKTADAMRVTEFTSRWRFRQGRAATPAGGWSL